MPARTFRTPCLNCGQLTTGSSYCPKHLAIVKAKSANRLNILHSISTKRDKYKGDYAKQAKAIKKAALDSNADCPLCGKPLSIGGSIHADHIYPELGADSPLQAVHASCNLRKGNRSPKQD